MWKIIWTLSILITIFLLNLWFYYFNEDYRFFIKKMKNSDDVIYIDDNLKIDDEDNFKDNNKDLNLDKDVEQQEESVTVWIDTIDDKWSFGFWEDYVEYKNNELEKEEQELKKEIVMSDVWKEFLNNLYAYKLSKIEVHSSLFDITTEYPDDYIEYISPDLIFYYFPGKSYNSILDIFKAISFDLPFTIKETNNFFEKTFYINLDEDISDNFVRIVINYKNNVFWLKIKKDSYNDIKSILKKLEYEQ